MKKLTNEEIITRMPTNQEVATVAEALKQLGDVSRLRIFWLLCHHEACVSDIAAIVSMSSPAVSHHLRILKANNLVISRREGKEMYYKATESELVDMLHHTIEHLASITCPSEETL